MPSSSASDIGLTTEQLAPADGYHCGHFFYRFDRAKIAQLDVLDSEGFEAALTPQANAAPARMQLGIVSGHKADFSVMGDGPRSNQSRICQSTVVGFDDRTSS